MNRLADALVLAFCKARHGWYSVRDVDGNSLADRGCFIVGINNVTARAEIAVELPMELWPCRHGLTEEPQAPSAAVTEWVLTERLRIMFHEDAMMAELNKD